MSNSALHELTPAEVQEKLHRGEIHLVDVREPAEHAAERIAGAVLHPLSKFEPKSLPAGRPVVLHCGVGARSAKAVGLCQAAGVKVDTHLQGGLKAWKAAGLPTTSG
jgi:rhodanese-related sulfurtransferase